MFQRHSSAAAIERHLRAIESELAQIGQYAGRQAADGAPAVASNIGDQISTAIVGVLNDIADRYRSGRRFAGDEAVRLGNEAVRAGTRVGNDALNRLAVNVERRPLAALAVAIGVGVLIGMAGRRH